MTGRLRFVETTHFMWVEPQFQPTTQAIKTLTRRETTHFMWVERQFQPTTQAIKTLTRCETTHFMWVERQFQPTTRVIKTLTRCAFSRVVSFKFVRGASVVGIAASRLKLKGPPV
jgi:hypothetical protein